MNVQDIIIPIGDAMQWTFELLMDGNPGFPEFFNWTIICVGTSGLVYWLIAQAKFNKKAAKDGTIA